MEQNTPNPSGSNGLTNSELWTLGIGLVIAILLFIFGAKLSTPPEPVSKIAAQQSSIASNVNVPQQSEATQTASTNQTKPMGKNISTDPHVQIYEDKVGTGLTIKSGQTAIVNYTGKLADGTVFDASANHGGPASFQIGVGKVIKGWDIGIVGMKVGGKRTLVIDPTYGYGNQQVGPIPPNSTLTFEVELVGIK